jgi:hypothetical protein
MKRYVNTFLGKLFLTLAVAASVFSCKSDDEEKSKIKIAFSNASLSIAEDENDVAQLVLESPAKEDEQVTLSVTSTQAIYGLDYIISKAIFPEDEFVVTVPQGATVVEVPVYALADFEDESDESFTLTIVGSSDGLETGTQTSEVVTLENVVQIPDENRAISFDGIDDYVDLGNIYDDLALPVTLTSWIYVDPTAGSAPLGIFATQDDKDTKYHGFNFFTSTSSYIGMNYGDGTGGNNPAYRRSKSAPLNSITGRWVNVAVVIRGPLDMSLYLNGVELPGEYSGTSNLPMQSLSPTEKATIGFLKGNESFTYPFKGLIDEVKIWDRALTEAEIQVTIFNKSENTEEGLIGYWDFDESQGTSVLDKSANHFNGTMMGGTRVASQSPVK